MKRVFIIILVLLSSVSYGQRKIFFAGREWYVKSGLHAPPGNDLPPNNWSNSNDNVFVDQSGALHLTIKKGIDNKWYCSEVYSLEHGSFGEYQFMCIGRPDLEDPSVVFSPFIYSDRYWVSNPPIVPFGEIDIEFSTGWDENGINTFYSLHADDDAGNNNDFRTSSVTTLTGNWFTAYWKWEPNDITFQLIHGHYLTPPSPNFLVENSYYKLSDHPEEWELYHQLIPNAQNRLLIHLNLWLNANMVPINDQTIEYIISDIRYPPVIYDYLTWEYNGNKTIKLRDVVLNGPYLSSQCNYNFLVSRSATIEANFTVPVGAGFEININPIEYNTTQ